MCNALRLLASSKSIYQYSRGQGQMNHPLLHCLHVFWAVIFAVVRAHVHMRRCGLLLYKSVPLGQTI